MGSIEALVLIFMMPLLSKDEVKIAASAFTLASGFEEDFSSYLLSVARTILDGTVGRVVLLFDGDKAEQEKLRVRVKETLNPLKGNPQDRIEVFVATATEIEEIVAAIS